MAESHTLKPNTKSSVAGLISVEEKAQNLINILILKSTSQLSQLGTLPRIYPTSARGGSNSQQEVMESSIERGFYSHLECLSHRVVLITTRSISHCSASGVCSRISPTDTACGRSSAARCKCNEIHYPDSRLERDTRLFGVLMNGIRIEGTSN